MNKTFKSYMILLLVLGVVFFNGIYILLGNNTVKADGISNFVGISGSPNSGSALYNATNTYNYNGDNTFLTRDYEYYNTNSNGRNSNIVSSGAPQITVLTHGLNSDASAWSNDNNGNFAFDNESLITRIENELAKNNTYTNIYWARINALGELNLFDLKNPSNIDSSALNKYIQTETVNSIVDITKHIILVFETDNSDKYNYKVYEEFNYMLSKVVYDVKTLNGGVLPRINLIGHSRGGITNLQYALDHPDLVASVFSLGTPYFGSDTAATELGAMLCQYSDGLYDIIDRNIYYKYYNQLHNNFERLYSHIDFHALGGYSDSDFVFDSIIESNDQDIEAIMSDTALNTIKWAVKSLPLAVGTLDGTAEITDFILSLLRNEDYDESEIESYVQIIADLQYWHNEDNAGFWSNLWGSIVHMIPVAGCPYFMNDLLVDLSSQIGYDEHVTPNSSYGFTTYTKCFKESDYNNKTKKLSDPNMPAVVHNLEARDDDFINYILTKISIGAITSGYLYNQTSTTTATLTGYRGNLLTDEISIPSQIDGLTINKIAPDLFKGSGVSITALLIPSTVQVIEENAFCYMTSLSNVTFLGTSSLQTIKDGAFAGCTSLTSFNIPAQTTNISNEAFVGCENLSEITVANGNTEYSAENGILYNLQKTKLIYYPEGKNALSYTIPSTIIEIAPLAFYFNDNIETLHIENSLTIGAFAFANCSSLTDIYFYSYTVPTLGLCSFINDEITLYVPHSRQSVYVTAFAGYVNTASSIPITISFSSDGMVFDTLNTYFGANITGLTNPSKTGYNFAGWYDNTAYMGTAYANGGLWDTTSNMTVYAKWSPQTYYVYFTGYGSENLADKEVTYDALIGTMPSVSRTGYTFYGWKNQYDEYFTSDMIWQKLSNQTVSSDLRANQYTITYNGNGGTANAQNQSVYYDSVISSFASAYREGYTFSGWNTNANGSGQTFTAPYTYVIDDNTTLYAQYTANEYNVTFDKQGGIGGSDGVNATYNLPMPSGTSITAPTKNGYTFLGYYRYADGLGTKYYNADMTSANIWNLSDDTTLFAYWAANQYTVTLDQQNGSGGTNSVNATYNAAMPSGANIIAPARTGYSLQGYFQYANGGGTKYYNSDMTSNNVWNVAGNSTIYAYWTPNIYTVVLQKESGAGGSDSVNATYLGNMPSANAPTRVGYTFQGYFSLVGGLGTKYYNADMSSAHIWDVADNAPLYAYWVGNQYTVTFDKQGGNGGANAVIATYGSDMPTSGVSAPMRQGYVFKGYYEYTNANGTKYYDGPTLTSVHTWDKASTTTLYAYWEQEEYTITFMLYDGMTDSTTLHYGDHVQADYAPYRQHYEFKGYYSGQNGTGICYVRGVLSQTYGDFYTIEPESTNYTWNTYGNGILYAYWELLVIDYSYQIVVENEGYLPNGTIHIVSGANTVLNAPSIDGYTFKEWNVNGYTRTNGSSYNFELHRSYITGEITIHYYFGGSAAYSDGYLFAVYTKNPSCVAAGTMITLADGTQKRVELLTGNEMLLVWNMYTGQFDTAPILFIDHDTYALYQIINLYFSDGTVVRVIDEHAFWDFNLNKYVFLRQDAAQYIGHWFNKQTYDINNNMIWTSVQLTNVVLTQEYTTAWSPVTYGHLCIYVNGMLSMPGATTGLINIFEVDNTTMTINQAQYLADIATYGVFTYQEFAQLFDVPELVFNAFNGQYLKVSIGKGLIDYDTLGYLIERYSIFFEQI